MATDTTVNNLIINKLTKAQYEAIANPSDTELYLVPDEIDSTPTSGSDNPVKSGGVYTALGNKQDTLVSGNNIKTINNTSLLGSGNIAVLEEAAFVYDIDASGLVDGQKTIQGSDPYNAIHAAYQAGKMVYVRWTNDDNSFPNLFLPLNNKEFAPYSFFLNIASLGATYAFEVDVHANRVEIQYGSGELYSKPSTGIPATDLASAVQTSLGKADTAMQAFIYDIDASNLDENGEKIVQSSIPYTAIHAAYQAGKTIYVRLTNNIDYPFILNMVSINGFTEGGYEFTAMLQNGSATYTAHVDIGSGEYYIECNQKFFLDEEIDPTVPSWAKQSTKPTYTASEVGALPDNTSIPDSLSDLSEDTTHRTVTDNEKSTWNNKANKVLVVNHGTSDTTYTIAPNVCHTWGTVESLSLSFEAPSDNTIVNMYMFEFTSGSTATSLSLPQGVLWADNKAPTIATNTFYEITVKNNHAKFSAFPLS